MEALRTLNYNKKHIDELKIYVHNIMYISGDK